MFYLHANVVNLHIKTELTIYTPGNYKENIKISHKLNTDYYIVTFISRLRIKIKLPTSFMLDRQIHKQKTASNCMHFLRHVGKTNKHTNSVIYD